MDKERIEKAVREIIEAIGEDPDHNGLRNTPKRVAELYTDIFSGNGKDPKRVLQESVVDETHKEMIIIKDLPFFSMCEHHLLPFFGKVDVAYIPSGKIVGLSKIAEVVDIISKKPQLQERMTSQIANTINEAITPRGVLVVLRAEHLCMNMRGVKQGSKTITSAIRGIFLKNDATRLEAFSLLDKESHR